MRRWTSAAAIVVLLGVAVADDDKPKDGKGAKGDAPATKPADDDDLPTQDLRAGGDEKKRYFVHGPKKDAKAPKDGFSVLYVLPGGDGAKGKPFFIDHSPDDKRCAFKLAEQARDALKKAGASVEFVTYEGGHGWNGDVFGRLKKGIEHLTKNAPK